MRQKTKKTIYQMIFKFMTYKYFILEYTILVYINKKGLYYDLRKKEKS